jgi:hypothetical protein
VPTTIGVPVSGASGFAVQSPDMSRGFPEGIVIDPEDPGRMYAGTRAGGELFTTGDAGETWVKLDVTVPAVAKMNIAHR